MYHLSTSLQDLINPRVLDDTRGLSTPSRLPTGRLESAFGVPELDTPAAHRWRESHYTAWASLLIGVLAAGFGVLTYAFSQTVGAEGLRLLASLAGAAALLYVGSAVDASRPGRALLHLAVSGVVFACSMVGLEHSVYLLALAFLLHAVWGSVNAAARRSGDGHANKPFMAWSVFNVTLMLLLILNSS